MISKRSVKLFVREGELTKIENYEKAIADKTQLWECHHRLELTLDGEFAHSVVDLIRMDMYYNRPYFELVFVTKAEHNRIHSKARSEESQRKWLEAHKGIKFSEERKKNISEALKGKKFSEEHRKRMSETRKNKPKSQFGKKYFEHYGYSRGENIKQYDYEKRWYYSHNSTCSWE